MFILLDGPDRTGKDTAARALLAHFQKELFLLLHTVHIKNYTALEYYRWYEEIFKLSQQSSLVLNRTHLSEYYFGKTYRGYDSSQIFELERLLKDDVFLFVFTDKVENLLAREDGLSIYKSKEDKEKEIAGFKEGFLKSSIKNKLLINIENKNEKEVFEELLTFIKQRS